MNIWIIGRGYPTPENKMWGSFELEQAKLLARNKNDVVYISLTLSFFGRKDPRGLRIFEDNAVKVYAYSHFYFPGKMGIYLEEYESKCWKMLFEKAEKESGIPDIIHVHYPSMISSIKEVEKYRNRGVKLFVTEHWSRVLTNNLKKQELNRLKYYANHAHGFASVSKSLEDATRELVDVTVPMIVIPNIVSPVFYKTVEEKKSDKFIFLTVGRLVSIKQFDIVIMQFLKVFFADKRVMLRIVGDGSERKRLESIAGGNEQIVFTGELSMVDTAREIASANALISFSKYETFAVPVAEAWACGKPVIVTAKSGISSYVNEKNGIIVEDNDPEQLREAIEEIFIDYNRYNHREISSFAKKEFCDEAILEKLTKMYGE